jgi:hypothetical protein
MEETHQFDLSSRESEFLDQLASQDDAFADFLGSHAEPHGRRKTIQLGCADVERLRDYLTTKLAQMGFDRNYSPNEAGDILEQLIDKFHLY